jgi:hypothetical protein
MAQGIKTGGRKAGTQNRLTYQTRQLLVDVLASEFESLPETLAKLEPAHRIDAVCKLAKFALPTMAAESTGHAEQQGLLPEDKVKEAINDKNILSLISL